MIRESESPWTCNALNRERLIEFAKRGSFAVGKGFFREVWSTPETMARGKKVPAFVWFAVPVLGTVRPT